MLFVVVHTHRPELCPVGNSEILKNTFQLISSDAHAKKTGVKVFGSYHAPPEHTTFFLVEADEYERIVDFMKPLMTIGTAKITPVSPLGEVVEKWLDVLEFLADLDEGGKLE